MDAHSSEHETPTTAKTIVTNHVWSWPEQQPSASQWKDKFVIEVAEDAQSKTGFVILEKLQKLKIVPLFKFESMDPNSHEAERPLECVLQNSTNDTES